MTGNYHCLVFISHALAAAYNDGHSDTVDLLQHTVVEDADDSEDYGEDDDYDLDDHYEPSLVHYSTVDTRYTAVGGDDLGGQRDSLLMTPTTTKIPGIIAGEDLELTELITQSMNEVLLTNGKEQEERIDEWEKSLGITNVSKGYIRLDRPELARNSNRVDNAVKMAMTTGGKELFQYYYYDIDDGDQSEEEIRISDLRELEEQGQLPEGETAASILANSHGGERDHAFEVIHNAELKMGGFGDPNKDCDDCDDLHVLPSLGDDRQV